GLPATGLLGRGAADRLSAVPEPADARGPGRARSGRAGLPGLMARAIGAQPRRRRASARSAKRRAGVTGTSRITTPRSATAASTAFAIAAAPGRAPLSPTPLIPSSLMVEGWS